MATNELPELTPEQDALQILHDRVSLLEKIATKVPKPVLDQVKIYLGDNDSCLPTPDNSHGFDLKFSSDSSEQAIPPRMAFPLDCGFSVEMPKGMRMVAQTTEDWAMRGLVLTMNTYDEDISRRRATVMAYNVGKQILAFRNGQVIGKVWFVKSDQVALVSCK